MITRIAEDQFEVKSLDDTINVTVNREALFWGLLNRDVWTRAQLTTVIDRLEVGDSTLTPNGVYHGNS